MNKGIPLCLSFPILILPEEIRPTFTKQRSVWFVCNVCNLSIRFTSQIHRCVVIDMGDLWDFVDAWRVVLRWTGHMYHAFRRWLCLLVDCIRATCWIPSFMDCSTYHSADNTSKFRSSFIYIALFISPNTYYNRVVFVWASYFHWMNHSNLHFN